MRTFVLFAFPLWFLLYSCQSGADDRATYQHLKGETMGTTYHLTFREEGRAIRQAAIDSLLEALNAEVSTYIPSSIISRFNREQDSLQLSEHPHFAANARAARDVWKRSRGAFDPTVMPLVNYWGFGYAKKKPVTAVDSQKVDSLIRLVGLDKLQFRSDGLLLKKRAGIQLDFSGIAKGYGVDAIAGYLESRDVKNYMVEIGGEVRARGRNEAGNIWTIGINLPREEAGTRELQAVVSLKDRALATSGNYRNYYEVKGQKYSHTINPRTGFPERNRLLSASVFAPDCMTADAYATAFMVLGPERALELARRQPGLETYLIIGTAEGGMKVEHTPAVADWIDQLNR